ncbi:hypothetical protein ANN_05802 [Periplaneta americana]|uniref:Uncharacterized protein n=1 Tax=Periplaneta americana TaxID=6978 RepID=A0ABQ8TBU0_PERAM|nr:hypothetical protein ANN_05802 [Periplaneta americana]
MNVKAGKGEMRSSSVAELQLVLKLTKDGFWKIGKLCRKTNASLKVTIFLKVLGKLQNDGKQKMKRKATSLAYNSPQQGRLKIKSGCWGKIQRTDFVHQRRHDLPIIKLSQLDFLPEWAATSHSGQPLAAARVQQSTDQETTIHHRISADKVSAVDHAQIDIRKSSPKKLKYSPPPPSPPPTLRSKSSSLPSLSAQQSQLSFDNRSTKCSFSKISSGNHAKSATPAQCTPQASADNSCIKDPRCSKPKRNNTATKQPSAIAAKFHASYMMKLKERLILGFSVAAVLFTLVLVIDLQMDLGMSGHHLVPSHGRVKFGDGGVDGPGSAYNSFRKRFLQRSNNGSREMSSGGATTNNGASQQQDGGGQNGNVLSSDGRKVAPTNQKPVEEEPHDDFSDLLDYVINNAAEVDRKKDSEGFLQDVVVRSSVGVSNRLRNPTLAEILNIPERLTTLMWLASDPQPGDRGPLDVRKAVNGDREQSNNNTNLLMAFKEPGGSLPPSHKPAIGPYPEQDYSSLYHHIPPPSNPF